MKTSRILMLAALTGIPHAFGQFWNPSPGSRPHWNITENWGAWSSVFGAYPGSSFKPIIYTPTIGDYEVVIPDDVRVSVGNISLSNNGRVVVEGWLEIRESGSLISKSAGGINSLASIRGNISIRANRHATEDNLFSQGALSFPSETPTGNFLGAEKLHIEKEGTLELVGQGAKIVNWANFLDDSPLGYSSSLQERVRINRGLFRIVDRNWHPAPAWDETEFFDHPELTNYGSLEIVAEKQDTVVGGLDGVGRSLLRNHGTISIDGRKGFYATMDTGGILDIPAETFIFLAGDKARLGMTNEALHSLSRLYGWLILSDGAAQDLGATRSLTLDRDPRQPKSFWSACLYVSDPGSRFACGDLLIEDGKVWLGDYGFNLIDHTGQFDDHEEGFGSFESGDWAGVLSQPDYRAAHGTKSLNLAAGEAAFNAPTEPGKAYTLSFETYGELTPLNVKVTIGSPNPMPLAEATFSAPAIVTFADATYSTRKLTFMAVDATTLISIAAEDSTLSAVGPVIDRVRLDLAVVPDTASIEVNGALTVKARITRIDGIYTGGSHLAVGNGTLRAGRISLESPEALMQLNGSVVRGAGTSTVPVSVASGARLSGYGDIYCDNLAMHGELAPHYGGGEGGDPDGPAPFEPLVVHGQVTMFPGSSFGVELWERNASPLKVVSGPGGDGSIVLEGGLKVTYQYDNPPRRSDVFPIISAVSLTGTFNNLVSGRVAATSEGYNKATGQEEYANGSFAVIITGDAVLLADFDGSGPLYTFASWAQSKGIPAVSRTAVADPDRDGRINLLEYALGTSPTVGGADETGETALLLGTDLGNLFSYQRPAGTLACPDIDYQVEVSEDMVSWTPVAQDAATATRISAEHEEVTVRVPQPSTGHKQFMRLSIRAHQ